MSIQRLMSQPLTVQAMGPATQDVYGDWIQVALGPAVAELGYLELVTSVEFQVNRDTTVTTWEAWLWSTTTANALSYLNFSGQRFQVIGDPWHVYNPRSKAISHVKCKLVVVSG